MTTTTPVDEGRELARYSTARRAALAAQARDLRAMLTTLGTITPEVRVSLAQHVWDAALRLIDRAPVRLASRRDLIRHARYLRQHVRHVNAHTDWDALWCGQQDALGDRLDGYMREAAALRAYARTLRHGGTP
jgi:hypothetical protein